ncbi:DUF4012 domain-containing protein [Patescibacteria group bacterium]|nr:DUF4012 domain-containing protein [Patescibacteria group bacterium]MBU1563750.1 DUF4012 domain-containing protein [Patescibacteria group bacterium]
MGKNNQTKFILNALFDVKPVTQNGDLDMERIKKVGQILDLRKEEHQVKLVKSEQGRTINLSIKKVIKKPDFVCEELLNNIETLPTKEEILSDLALFDNIDNFLDNVKVPIQDQDTDSKGVGKKELNLGLNEFYFPEVASYKSTGSISLPQEKPNRFVKIWPKSLFGFIGTGLLISLIIPTAAWLSQGLMIKDDVLSNSMSAYQNLMAARQSLEESNWQAAEQNFGSAYSDFYQAHQEINKLGHLTLGILEQLPGGDLVSSGSRLVKVGENLAQAGQGLAAAVNLFSYDNLFNLINLGDSSGNLTDLMVESQDNLSQALFGIKLANQELEEVKTESLPDDIQEGVVSLKEKLPLLEKMLIKVESYSEVLLKILGHDNPRQYLLIFQNNSEIRATGGFIGTYGLLTLDKGTISNLFVDGIFNADGQLHEKIIPPRPIQKVSTSWSMHDANWFADFPTSAQKIQWFYEKTGGPTTDGVISLTPILVERLLELTGPINMPEYGVVLSASNFVELIQYKVEVDYDKELNRPKKILADFTPLFIEKLSQLSSQQREQAIEIIFDCLEEKHILFYFNNSSLEDLIIDQGWAGQLSSADRDYLSVVSSNINGYKTDRMVKETIDHQAEIQPDGSIIDTLTIVREHQGGQEKYDWWNRVNSNYLRVYLPKGSQLISAQGQSLEIYQPPVNYQEQGFKTDPLVNLIESGMVIDKKTGTHIFEESGKTVFGNWVYVSPGEKVILTYRYKLPFKIDLTKTSDSYSLLAQKQLGSLGSNFSHKLKFPEDWQISWRYPDNFNSSSGLINFISDLKTDKFLGATFGF